MSTAVIHLTVSERDRNRAAEHASKAARVLRAFLMAENIDAELTLHYEPDRKETLMETARTLRGELEVVLREAQQAGYASTVPAERIRYLLETLKEDA